MSDDSARLIRTMTAMVRTSLRHAADVAFRAAEAVPTPQARMAFDRAGNQILAMANGAEPIKSLEKLVDGLVIAPSDTRADMAREDRP